MGVGKKDISVVEIAKGVEEARLRESTLELEMNSISEEGKVNKSEVDTAISVPVGLGVTVWGCRTCDVMDGASLGVGVEGTELESATLEREATGENNVVSPRPTSRLEVREGESNKEEVSVAEVAKGTEEVGPTKTTLKLERLGTLVMDCTSEEGRIRNSEVDTAMSISVGLGVRVWGCRTCDVVDGTSLCVGVVRTGLVTAAEKLNVLGTGVEVKI